MRIVTMCTAHGVALEGQPMMVANHSALVGEEFDKTWDVDLSEMGCPEGSLLNSTWCQMTWAVCVVQ